MALPQFFSRGRYLYVSVVLLYATFCQASLLTLADAVRLSLENSPDIAQVEAQRQSAVQRIWASLAPAEPTVSLSNTDLVRFGHLDTAASQTIQLNQPVGFPGRAFLNRSQARAQADAIEAQKHALETQLSANVKIAYYNLQLAQKNIELNEDTRTAFERAREIARRRYESGASAQVDFLNAQVALLSNENDLADLRANEKAGRAQLNIWLRRDTAAEYGVEPLKMSNRPSVTLTTAAERMMAHRFEIKAAIASARAAEKAYQLAWYSLAPDFQITLGTTKYREPYASPYSGALAWQGTPGPPNSDPRWPTRTYSIGLQFTIPIWFLFNERAQISGASADRAAAERGVDMQINQAKIALENVVASLSASKEKIERFENRILPLSDQSYRLALTDYSSGRINFQTLADTATTRRQTRMAYNSAVIAYLTNFANLEQLGGEIDHDVQ